MADPDVARDLVIWMRGEDRCQTITYISSHVPRAVVEMLGRVTPALAVQDPVAFQAEWRNNRSGVQRRVDEALSRAVR